MTNASVSDSAPAAPIYQRLLPGDVFPALRQTCNHDKRVAFETLAGRYQLFGFFLSAEDPEVRQAIDAVAARADLFDDRNAAFAAVSVDGRDRETYGQMDVGPGVRFAWDFDWSMSQACGAIPLNSARDGASAVSRKWVLVDPSMHVLHIWPMRGTPVAEVIAAVEALPPPDLFGGVSRPAPVLMLPNVFEPELCARLIELHRVEGGAETGIYRRGVQIVDHSFKRRRDLMIRDPALIESLNARIARRVQPQIEKLFFLRAEHVDRHLVGCYSAEDGGHFAPHIDNGAPATAHRRFAVSINLNDGFEGGEVVFPEYNMHGYKAPPGWAVVFPAAILHAVRQVTSGVRYAFLPFVYDQAGADIRDAERARVKPA